MDLSDFMDENLPALPGFNFKYGASVGKGKGVAIYAKAAGKTFSECCQGKQCLLYSTLDLSIAVCYRSQNGFPEKLVEFLKRYEREQDKKISIVCGDFNFHSETSNVLTEYLKGKHYCQKVTNPSHVLGNILDHFYVKCNYKADVTIEQKVCYFSDHDMIFVNISV